MVWWIRRQGSGQSCPRPEVQNSLVGSRSFRIIIWEGVGMATSIATTVLREWKGTDESLVRIEGC